jgi:hypothetical protein
MADDILSRELLEGISEDSITTLLGPRPETAYFSDWDYVYWLGPERGLFGLDSEWLVIKVGSDGRVTESKLVRD